MLRSTGGLGCDAQAVCFIGSIQAVVIPVTDVRGPDAGPVAAGELVAVARVVSTPQLITAVPAVIHTIAAGEEEYFIRHYSMTNAYT